MNDAAQAWLLDLGGLRAAIAPPELAAVLRRPALQPSAEPDPAIPYLVEWQGHTLPVLDLGARFEDARRIAGAPFLAVVLYPDSAGRPCCGGIPLVDPPDSVTVPAEAACPLPEPDLGWRACALSCFLHEGEPVPILDLAALFGPDRNATG